MRSYMHLIFASLLAFTPLIHAENTEEATFVQGEEMLSTYLENRKLADGERESEIIHEASVEEALKNPNEDEADQKTARSIVVVPFLQKLAIHNGALTHFAHYKHCIIATKMSGPHFGCQYFMTPLGDIFLVNPLFSIDEVPGGRFLRHEYHDSTVLTGQDQIIIFY
ncbi:MAG: hypothetical protein CK425_02450 [Parachlamydia sp.]|nr:MAG: hypothetical protein CK425_02450 [Parachlamydia sp.]